MGVRYFSFESLKGSTVLITGNTGFKGSWLALWLSKIGANVVGVSDRITSKPSMFEVVGSSKLYDSRFLDILETNNLGKVIKEIQPDFIFHLAAQALVHRGFEDPFGTWMTNTMGTASVAEAIAMSKVENIKVVFITSDKVYKNKEWAWGYREIDELGGSDPYGNSKAAAELVVESYSNSKNFTDLGIKVATVRAGNVIGGGDWSDSRIVPDAVRSWMSSRPITLRNPTATRPWQHVLEPLSGYLQVALGLEEGFICSGQSFNFGPSGHVSHTVEDLVKALSKGLSGNMPLKVIIEGTSFAEDRLLRLSSEKAVEDLGWSPILDFEQTVTWISDWYRAFSESRDMLEVTMSQITNYQATYEKGRKINEEAP